MELKCIRSTKSHQIEYYRNNIGETTEFDTVITQELVDGVQRRLNQLENKEDKRDKWRRNAFSDIE